MSNVNMKRLVVTTLAALFGLAVRAASPLDGAPWVCPAELESATNVTAVFKVVFSSPAAVSGRLALSADGFYAVELNGKSVVEHAHLADTPPQRYYDTVALDEIKEGANELTIRLYVVGCDTFQVMAARPGFAFDLEAPGVSLTSAAPMDWRISAKDRSEGVGLMTMQVGWTFEHDARVPEQDWRSVRPDERRTPDCRYEPRPAGIPVTSGAVPWRIVDQGALDGSPAEDDCRNQMDATAMHTIPAGLFYRGDSVDPRLFRDGFYLIVDVGREESGLLDIAFDADAGTIVDVGHGEHMKTGRVRTSLYGYRFVGRIRAGEGETAFVRWQRRMAGRYLQLHVRGAKTHFALRRATLRPVMREMVERRAPAGLDSRRQLVWTTAVRTLHLCMHEHYEDCPWREQALYANDARNQILCGRYAFENDGAFAAMSLELLARGCREDGWLEMCMPARIGMTIPSFTFSWCLSVRDHWNLYGDRAVLEKMAPTVKRVLERRLAELRDGLLPTPADAQRYWPFYDWAPGLDGCPRVGAGAVRFDAPLNMLLIQALEADAPLMELAGEKALAARWRAAANALRQAVRARFWNEGKIQFDTYAGDVDWANMRVKTGDGHELVQALALLSDCVPPAYVQDVAMRLSEDSEWIATTLSQSLHKYEALIRAGPAFGRRAMAQMDALWGKMLDAGATSFWEMKDGWKDFDGAGSLCHGWSAIPVYFYARYPKYFK